MNDIVLIVVAHSDDEAISMGGTIKKHVEKGDSVYVVSMTDGVGAREEKINDAAGSYSVMHSELQKDDI